MATVDFNVFGPPAPTEEVGPPASMAGSGSKLADLFQTLDASGSQAPPPPKSPFRYMIPGAGPILAIKEKLARDQQIQQAVAPVSRASTALLDELVQSGIPVDRARSVVQLKTAQRLSQLGFTEEANALRTAGLDNLKLAEVSERAAAQAELNLIRTQTEIENVGDTAVVNSQEERAKLEAELAQGGLTDEEVYDRQRRLGELDSYIEKLTTLTGRTQTDLLANPTFMRQMMKEHLEDTMLLNRLDLTDKMLNATNAKDIALLARTEARLVGALQATFGFEPTQSQQENIERIINQRGSTSFVAAGIRHALTGAQMSQFEIQYLEPFLPAPGDPLSVQKAKVRLIRKFIASDIDTRLNLILNPEFSQQFMNIGVVEETIQEDETVRAAREALAGRKQ